MMTSEVILQRLKECNVKAAVYQGSSCREDVNSTLSAVESTVMSAASSSVDVVLFPELFYSGYDVGVENLKARAISVQSDEMKRLQSIASNHRVAFAIGYPERADSIVYNSCCLISDTGEIILNYRKTHLWNPFGQVSYECAAFTEGSSLPVAELHISRIGQSVRVGVLICFDIEFPEPARVLALQGASVVFVCTANVGAWSQQVAIHSRAAENHVFVLYSNMSGHCLTSENPNVYCGQSAILDPNGRPLVQASEDASGLFSATLEGSKYLDSVHRNDYLRQRRPELYSSLVLTDK